MKYALVMNDMRSSNIENVSVVRIDADRLALVDWYISQLAPVPWKDGTWHKRFVPGSELEWMNPVHSLDVDNDYWGGVWIVADDTPVGAGVVKASSA